MKIPLANLLSSFGHAYQYLILNAISDTFLKITNYTEHTKVELPTNEAQTLWKLLIGPSLLCVCALGQCMYCVLCQCLYVFS